MLLIDRVNAAREKKHNIFINMLHDHSKAYTTGWPLKHTQQFARVINQLCENPFDLVHDNLEAVSKRGVNPAYLEKLAKTYKTLADNPLSVDSRVLKTARKTVDYFLGIMDNSGIPLAKPEEPVGEEQLTHEEIVDRVCFTIANEDHIEIVRKDPTVCLFTGSIEATLGHTLKSTDECLTSEQSHQLACLAIKGGLLIAMEEDVYTDRAVQYIAETLAERGIIPSKTSRNEMLSLDVSYTTHQFYEESYYFIPTEYRAAYKRFVERYMRIPYLFAGGYNYTSFNIKFCYITTVFFRALQSHDFDTKTDISEDNVTLSLISFWKANRILWDGESGIIPRINLFQITSLLNGSNVVSLSLTRNLPESEGMLYRTAIGGEVQYKTQQKS